jgi:hypothetical protein
MAIKQTEPTKANGFIGTSVPIIGLSVLIIAARVPIIGLSVLIIAARVLTTRIRVPIKARAMRGRATTLYGYRVQTE